MSDLRFSDLLRRWLTGDFGRAHERELRDLAASDEFRREAWEGFSAMPEADHAARLARLRAQLQARNEPFLVKFFASPRLMAAAAVLVLAVAAVIFFPKTDEASSTQPAISAKNAAPESSPAATAAEAPAEQPATSSFPAPSAPVAAAKPHLPAKPAANAGAEPAVAAADAPSATTEIASQPAEMLEKEAAEKQPEPEVFAAPTPPAVAERAKKFAAEQPATATRSLPAAPAVQHNTDAKPDMARVRRDAADELPAQAAPAGGWEVFQEHLRQNARLTPEARAHNVSGAVRVQFVVGADGMPRNFLTLKSLGYGCDEEAIRLVNDFEWLPGKNSALTVEVRFVR